jgi:hypothetical protein
MSVGLIRWLALATVVAFANCQTKTDCKLASDCMEAIGDDCESYECVAGVCMMGYKPSGKDCTPRIADTSCSASQFMCNSEGQCLCPLGTRPPSGRVTVEIAMGTKSDDVVATTSKAMNPFASAGTTTTTSSVAKTATSKATTTRQTFLADTAPLSDISTKTADVTTNATTNATTTETIASRDQSAVPLGTSGNADNEASTNDLGLANWVIAAIAAGAGVVLIAAVVAITCVVIRHKRRSKSPYSADNEDVQPPPSETVNMYGAVPRASQFDDSSQKPEPLNGDYEFANIQTM